MDFKNAFPTMSHEMVAALGLMCIPFLYIRPMLYLLRAPYLYSVGKGYVPRVYHHPRAGTRQGDPLSPAMFSLVASFVIFPLQDLDPGLTVMMYADDLIIFLDGQANPQLLGKIWTVVSCFGQFSGLKVNLNKTAAIVRNCGGPAWAKCFGEIGVDVKNFVKYLGVRLGNIRHHQDDQGWGLTIEQAFAPALQEAFRRARVVSTLQLSMDERAFMLTSWILSVVARVSKAYYAPTPVITQLKLVYHVTMGTNSWGITLPILSRPRLQGRLALPEPELSLLGEPHKYQTNIKYQISNNEDLLCMGGVNWVYTVQRQPSIYPTGHGSNCGTNVPGMVGEGTLLYPAGGPAGGPPKKPGPVAAVALCLLPE